jgi:hypothetical protein
MKNTVAAGLLLCLRLLLDRSECKKIVSLQIKTLRGSRGPVASSAFPGESSRPVASSGTP